MKKAFVKKSIYIPATTATSGKISIINYVGENTIFIPMMNADNVSSYYYVAGYDYTAVWWVKADSGNYGGYLNLYIFNP